MGFMVVADCGFMVVEGCRGGAATVERERERVK